MAILTTAALLVWPVGIFGIICNERAKRWLGSILVVIALLAFAGAETLFVINCYR